MSRPPVLTAGAAWSALPVVRDGGWLGVVMAVVDTSGIDYALLTETGDYLAAESGALLLTA